MLSVFRRGIPSAPDRIGYPILAGPVGFSDENRVIPFGAK